MSAHVTDRLSAYMDRELSVVDAAAVREHLAACAACAARLGHLAAVDGRLRDLPAEAPAGYFDSFASRVRGRIEKAPRARAGFRLPVWSWAVAAALLVAVVLPRMAIDTRAPRSKAQATPPLPASVTAAPSATPLPAKRGAQPRADAPAAVEPEGAQKLRAVGYVEGPSGDDKARANAPADTAEARGRSAARKEASQRFAGAPPAVAPTPPAPAVAQAALSDESETRTSEAQLLEKDRFQEAEAVAPGAAGAPGRVEEGKPSRRAAAAGPGAPAPPAPGDDGFRALEARATTASLIEQRDAWRAFVLRHPDDARADDARVRVVALGVDIARRTDQGSDAAQARKDAADYLARKDAAQKERVSALLERLSH